MPLPSDFHERIKTMPDDEVLDILARPSDYLPEAVELARAERARRGLADAGIAIAEERSKAVEEDVALRATIPLSPGLKWACFLLPINVAMYIRAVTYSGTGYKRKAHDAAFWMGCGLLFYLALEIVGSHFLRHK
jgi:hypothetical protein